MAGMYTRKKVNSGSKSPFSLRLKQRAPEWVEMSAEEVEEKVTELYNQGLSTSRIGILMRDSYSVPGVALVTGKKVIRILKERESVGRLPEDLQNLMRKALKLRLHLERNKRDIHNKRSLQLTESKVRRLAKYYKRERVLPEDWKYKPELAEVMMGSE